MNRLKKAVQVGLASGLMVLGLGLVRDVQAQGNPDTMTVTVTPGNISYAVLITSPEVQGYDFAQVNVGATTISTLPIGVQNKGNISAFFSVGIVDVTPTYAWTNSGITPSATTYVMQAAFVATGAAQPLNATFTGAAKNVPIAGPGTADSKFNQGAGLAGKTVPNATKDLWLQLQMPTSVDDAGQHTLILSINGQNG